MLLLGVASVAPAKGDTPPGQIECKEHTDTCGKKAKTVRDIDVFDGENVRFVDGSYLLEGNVTVHDGGSFTVRNATVFVADSSVGFRVLSGGVLTFEEALVLPANASVAPRFRIVAEAGASFSFVDSTLSGGAGMRVDADDALVAGSTLRDLALALATNGSDVTVASSRFTANDVSVRFEGGSPTLTESRLEGGTTCVLDYRTNPTITGNVFMGCHTGIEHVESHSRITDNTMDDDGEPPGAGIRVLGALQFADADPEGVLIEGNRLADYHSGIVVVSGRAFIRNNTIETSVLAGIRVEDNLASMDVRGNVVRASGGDGLQLVDVANVTVADNTVESSGGAGLRVSSATNLDVSSNLFAGSAGDGVVLDNAPDATLSGNEARASGGAGFLVRSSGVSLAGDSALANAGAGFSFEDAEGLVAEDLASTGNGEGVFLAGSGAAVLARVHANANLGHGFRFAVSADLGDVELVSPRAIANGGDGLLNEGASGVSVESGWFEDNAGFGARTTSLDAVVLAPLSYWGSLTGPTHALNPLGTGDEVSDGVVYLPFLTTPPA